MTKICSLPTGSVGFIPEWIHQETKTFEEFYNEFFKKFGEDVKASTRPYSRAQQKWLFEKLIVPQEHMLEKLKKGTSDPAIRLEGGDIVDNATHSSAFETRMFTRERYLKLNQLVLDAQKQLVSGTYALDREKNPIPLWRVWRTPFSKKTHQDTEQVFLMRVKLNGKSRAQRI